MNVSSPVHMAHRLRDSAADLTTYRAARSDSLSGPPPFNGRLYDVDPNTGFVPSRPLSRLQGQFTLWENALDQAGQVLKLGMDKGEEATAKRGAGEQWRRQLRSWPVLDAAQLGNKPCVLRRAHHVLALLLHFYIHSQPPVDGPVVIPRPLSIPLLHVSQKLDMPPILTFADVVLWNWELVNPEQPISLNNLRFRILLSGSETERNFYALSIAAELRGAEMLQLFERFMNLSNAAERTAIAAVGRDLERLVTIINEVSDILQSARDTVDPHTFYWVVRPWWNGSSEAAPWVFEGAPTDASYDLGGASAGQSSIMHALDIFLDVDHGLKQTRQPAPSAENRRADTGFMEKMRRYMPAEHRAYLVELAKHSIRELVLRTPALREPYNAAVEALKKFRDGHIRVGTLYIISQSRSVPPVSMGGAAATPPRADRSKGTGGNPVSTLLKAGRDATLRTMVKGE